MKCLINIGFNRSGTQSIAKYLRQFNLLVGHWLQGTLSKIIKYNQQNKKKLLDGLEQYHVLLDLEHFETSSHQSHLGFYKSYQLHFVQLEQQYPAACFIFTYRDVNQWIKSLLHHRINLAWIENGDDNNNGQITILEYMQKGSRLTLIELVQTLRKEYQDHSDNVRQYFIGSKSNKVCWFNLDDLDQSIKSLNQFLLDHKICDSNEDFTNHIFPKENAGSTKKLAFMVCCMDRTEHLLATLEKNLKDNCFDRDLIEFVVIHFTRNNDSCESNSNGNDNDNSIQNNDLAHLPCLAAQSNGFVKYFINRDFESWKAGSCRHTAFWYTRAELIYNLDCDNFTGLDGGKQLIRLFDLYGTDSLVYCGFNGNHDQGSFGRICLSNNNHTKLNSYDPSLPTVWCFDDSLLLLQSVFVLKLKILTASASHIESLLSGLLRHFIPDHDAKMALINSILRHAIIVEPSINSHQGVKHPREESFKTVKYECIDLAVQEDLQSGIKYVQNKFANELNLINFMTVIEAKNDIITIELNPNKKCKMYHSVREYLETNAYSIVLVTQLNDESDLEDAQNLIISALLVSLKISVMGSSLLLSKINQGINHDLNYPVDLIVGNYQELMPQKIVVLLNSNLIIKTARLVTHIRQLLMKGMISSPVILNESTYQNLSGTLEIRNRNPAHMCSHNFAKLLGIPWIVWARTNYGRISQQQILQKLLEPLITLGIEIYYTDDSQSPDLSQRHIIVTFGFDCYNKNIPICQSHFYLILQPEIYFNVAPYQNVSCLVIAKYQKTDLDTLICSSSIDQIALWERLSRFFI